jgi:hypothetical protein
MDKGSPQLTVDSRQVSEHQNLRLTCFKEGRMKKLFVFAICLVGPFLITGIDFYLCSKFDPKGTFNFSWLAWVISSFIPVFLNTYIKSSMWKITYSVVIVLVYIYLQFWLFEILAMESGYATM